MQAATSQYKLIKKVRDERFDEELIHQYDLLIHIGTRDLQAAVIDTTDTRLVLLEDYVLPNVNSEDELLDAVEQIFDSHASLRAGFWHKIKISFKNQKFVQVPSSLFIEEAAESYLQFNASYDSSSEDILCVNHQRTDTITVFAVWDKLKDWFQKIYPNKHPIFLHQSACLIDSVLKYADGYYDNPLYIYVDRFRLHVLSCKEGKLVYYNQFIIKQFADYVKYIMLVMKSLNMDQQTSQVVLWGYIGKNSPHYHEFYKYINNVTFGKRPDFLQFGYMFDEIQDHHFFDLYGMHLLE